MRLGGRVGAAIEVLQDIADRKRPAADALKDWGLSHRFAGSGDRAAIGNLVHDALRKKLSTAHLMNDDEGRALAFGTLWRQWNVSLDQMREAFADDKFAPEIPEQSLEAAAKRDFAFAKPHVEADIPDWCADYFEENFDDEWIAEASALSERAPLDMRVNTLKADRDKVQKQLAKFGAKPIAIARQGLRIAAGRGAARMPNVQSEPAFQKGWFEIQDEGSQIVADLVFPQPGEQVLDYCAGGGGKTLALAAMMEGKGQIHAYDIDGRRLSALIPRLKRSGAHNVQLVHPSEPEALEALKGQMDLVFVDAPCTGTGTWRRRPDAKWRLKDKQLAKRIEEQTEILEKASEFVKPGGRLLYATCSFLKEEDEDRVAAFLSAHPEFTEQNAAESAIASGLLTDEGAAKVRAGCKTGTSVRLTPRTAATDGFFFSLMVRTG